MKKLLTHTFYEMYLDDKPVLGCFIPISGSYKLCYIANEDGSVVTIPWKAGMNLKVSREATKGTFDLEQL